MHTIRLTLGGCQKISSLTQVAGFLFSLPGNDSKKTAGAVSMSSFVSVVSCSDGNIFRGDIRQTITTNQRSLSLPEQYGVCWSNLIFTHKKRRLWASLCWPPPHCLFSNPLAVFLCFHLSDSHLSLFFSFALRAWAHPPSPSPSSSHPTGPLSSVPLASVLLITMAFLEHGYNLG